MKTARYRESNPPSPVELRKGSSSLLLRDKSRSNKVRRRKVAVFDIDGTIFRSSLLIELLEALILEGVFRANVRKTYARQYSRWHDRKDSYEKYIDAVVRAFDSHIKGVREKDFAPVADRVISFHRNRVYRYTRDLLKELKKKDYYLLAISHSPMYVVGRFGKRLGFNKVYGRLLELGADKRFTGKGIYEDLIFDKAKVLKRAVEKEHLTLRDSVGVGDTESDIPFLKIVEKPICFNPNAELYKAAKRNKWRVVVERKDMIYKMTNNR
ncbi:MAG: HAD family phosphatase [Candidatus Liptonbacteria bacterium]|nr:HAD family phosphatase [Candidatus Liptonbacteria bacterium]